MEDSGNIPIPIEFPVFHRMRDHHQKPPLNTTRHYFPASSGLRTTVLGMSTSLSRRWDPCDVPVLSVADLEQGLRTSPMTGHFARIEPKALSDCIRRFQENWGTIQSLKEWTSSLRACGGLVEQGLRELEIMQGSFLSADVAVDVGWAGIFYASISISYTSSSPLP